MDNLINYVAKGYRISSYQIQCIKSAEKYTNCVGQITMKFRMKASSSELKKNI